MINYNFSPRIEPDLNIRSTRSNQIFNITVREEMNDKTYNLILMKLSHDFHYFYKN